MTSQVTFNFQEHSARIDRVSQLLVLEKDCFADRNVKRHLYDGLLRRLAMLNHSAGVFKKIPKRGSKNPGVYFIIELNNTLNSTYLNIRGILDNLAWALAHHLILIPTPSENHKLHRRFVNLFTDAFLVKLSNTDSELGKLLKDNSAWGRDFSNRRDPAAHRIPMYVPPAVVTEREAQEIQQQGVIALAKAKAGDDNALRDHLRSSDTSGIFLPDLIISEQNGDVIKDLFVTLNNDYATILDIVEAVVVLQFIRTPAGTALDSLCPPLPVSGL